MSPSRREAAWLSCAKKTCCHASVVIPTCDPSLVTPQTEGLQAVFWHLVVSHPKLGAHEAKWESITRPSPQ